MSKGKKKCLQYSIEITQSAYFDYLVLLNGFCLFPLFFTFRFPFNLRLVLANHVLTFKFKKVVSPEDAKLQALTKG